MRENWLRLFDDHDTAIIALAIVAIVSERLMRAELDPELQTLATPMPESSLAKCNISSIAAATGLNRETIRRKLNRLCDKGLVINGAHGVRLAPGFTQQELACKVVGAQLDELMRAANDLLRADVIALDGRPPAAFSATDHVTSDMAE